MKGGIWTFLHHSVNTQCLELARAHGETKEEVKNLQPTCYFLCPFLKSPFLSLHNSSSSPSLNSLIDCEFISGVARIRCPRRRAGFDPAALAPVKLIKTHTD